jgi:hypothetical protein
MKIYSTLLYWVLLVLLTIDGAVIVGFNDLAIDIDPDCLPLLVKRGPTIPQYLFDELLNLLLIEVVAAVVHQLHLHHLHLFVSDLNFLHFGGVSIDVGFLSRWDCQWFLHLLLLLLILLLLLLCKLLLQILKVLAHLVD